MLRVQAAEPHIKFDLGGHTLLFPAGYGDGARLNYFPDEAPAFISVLNAKPCRFLLVETDETYLMQGETLESAQPSHVVLGPSRDGSFDNDYAGITSVYRHRTSDPLLGFYHAEKKEPTRLVDDGQGRQVPAAYWSIGLVTSDDNGTKFSRVDQILRPAIPKDQVAYINQGIGDVCVIENGSGDYLYAYYTDINRRSESFPAGIALARCKTTEAGDPRSWRKLSDAEKAEFNGDALSGIETRVLLKDQCEVSQPHVTYIEEWRRYLMVCCVLGNQDYDPPATEHSGIYLYHSADGISSTALS